jgi:hypothetical protein
MAYVVVIKINIHISAMAHIRENLQEFLAYLVTNEILYLPVLLIYMLLCYLYGQIAGVKGLHFDSTLKLILTSEKWGVFV